MQQIDFVMDVNGSSGPNEESNMLNGNYTDIRRFKIATFDGCGGVKVSGVGCVVNLGASSSINTCNDRTWDSRLTTNGYCSNNAWAGAKKACSDIGMELPDSSKLLDIYAQKDNYSEIPNSGRFWSSIEVSKSEAWYADFDNINSSGGYFKPKCYGSGVLCVSD